MKRIQNREELEEVLQEQLVVLFKHSTRCSISARAHTEMNDFSAAHPDAPLFILHVVEDRPLSQYLAQVTGVRHESPQVLILESGTVRWHASHSRVNATDLQSQLEPSRP